MSQSKGFNTNYAMNFDFATLYPNVMRKFSIGIVRTIKLKKILKIINEKPNL
jgi:hypothetical protein